MLSSYYDIDGILAEEELIPVTNLLDFQHLAYLDPDSAHSHQRPVSPPSDGRSTDKMMNKAGVSYLPEGTKVKMPLWSIVKWAELGFVRLGLPSHYTKRARERIEADPADVNLRKKSEWFYMAGMLLINLIKRCVDESKRSRTRRNEINDIERESDALKKTLLLTYTGARLRRNFDWTLSNIEDDVSLYTQKLTEMELQLFRKAAAASHAHAMWTLHGSRRIHLSTIALKSTAMKTLSSMTKTPDGRRKRGNNQQSRFVSPDGRGTSSFLPQSKRTKAF